MRLMSLERLLFEFPHFYLNPQKQQLFSAFIIIYFLLMALYVLILLPFPHISSRTRHHSGHKTFSGTGFSQKTHHSLFRFYFSTIPCAFFAQPMLFCREKDSSSVCSLDSIYTLELLCRVNMFWLGMVSDMSIIMYGIQ